MVRWHYQGDVSPEYGGTFFDVSDWQHDYVSAVEITDLDSGCGFRGAVMIERKVINIPKDQEKLKHALAIFGFALDIEGDLISASVNPCTYDLVAKKDSLAFKLAIADACLRYGYADPDGYGSPEILQLESDGPMAFDGWRADKRLRANASLKNYIRKHYLKG